MAGRSPSGLVGRWLEFWYRRAWTTSLGVFRVLFAYCLFEEIRTTAAKSVSAIEGRFHLSYVDWIAPVDVATYEWLHAVQYPLVVLFGLGVWMRLAGGTLLLVQSYVFLADPLNFRNHPYFFLLVLGILLLSPADDAISVDAALRARKQGWERFAGSLRTCTAQRLVQVQVTIAYLWAAVHKMHPYYLEGHVLAAIVRDLPLSTAGSWLALLGPDPARVAAWLARPSVAPYLALTTIAIELFVPLALWSRLRVPGMAIGIAFHLSIALVMDIRVFSIAMIASYVLFLDDQAVRDTCVRLLQRLPRLGPRFACADD